jgi:predicted transcriptional regulator
MAKKLSTIDIEIGREGFFLFQKFGLGRSDAGEMEKLSEVRSMLNSEKARILHVIKASKPVSVYKLARILGRDFQSVRKDCQLLQKLELIELEKAGKGKRKSLKPVLKFDRLQINIAF